MAYVTKPSVFANGIALLGNNEDKLMNPLHQINTTINDKFDIMINKKSHEILQNWEREG